MKTKLLTASLIGALSLAGTAVPAFADGEDSSGVSVSGSVTLTSDYRFRGFSQTDKEFAAQAGVELAAGGFFAGAWGSNIDFNDEATYDSGIEVDLYVGYNFTLSEATSLTVKGVYYLYPDADTPALFPDYDYFELIGSLSHDFGKAAVSLEVAWSPDFFAESGDTIAFTGGIDVPLCEKLWFFDGGLAASGHLGYQDDTDVSDGYTYWDLGLSATAGIFTLDVRYIDTDVDEALCGDLCDSTVVVSGTVAFGG